MIWNRVSDFLPPAPTDAWEMYGEYVLTYDETKPEGYRHRIGRVCYYEHDDNGKPVDGSQEWRSDGEGWDLKPTHWRELDAP